MYGEDQLHRLQQNTFRYFWDETNPGNGLIPDNTAGNDIPASIAGVGLALACYPVGVERSFVSPRKGGRAYVGHVAILLERAAGSDAGRDRPSGLLLPFP